MKLEIIDDYNIKNEKALFCYSCAFLFELPIRKVPFCRSRVLVLDERERLTHTARTTIARGGVIERDGKKEQLCKKKKNQLVILLNIQPIYIKYPIGFFILVLLPFYSPPPFSFFYFIASHLRSSLLFCLFFHFIYIFFSFHFSCIFLSKSYIFTSSYLLFLNIIFLTRII